MSSRTAVRIGLTLFAVLVCRGALAAPQRPAVLIDHPVATDPAEVYDPFSRLAVSGHVLRPVGDGMNVAVYQVRGDGLVPLAGVSVPFASPGRFRCGIDPPAAGWKPGRVRIVVRLSAMPHVRESVEVAVVARPGPAAAERVIVEPPSSGVVVAMDEKPAPVKVPATTRFLVQGSIAADDSESDPRRMIEIELGGVKFDSRNLTLLREEGRLYYEVELTAPREKGEYRLRVRRPGDKNVEAEVKLLVTERKGGPAGPGEL